MCCAPYCSSHNYHELRPLLRPRLLRLRAPNGHANCYTTHYDVSYCAAAPLRLPSTTLCDTHTAPLPVHYYAARRPYSSRATPVLLPCYARRCPPHDSPSILLQTEPFLFCQMRMFRLAWELLWELTLSIFDLEAITIYRCRPRQARRHCWGTQRCADIGAARSVSRESNAPPSAVLRRHVTPQGHAVAPGLHRIC